jgi:hypothetical protein
LKYTAEEKVAILRRHPLDKVPVSDLCGEPDCAADGVLPLAKRVLRERSGRLPNAGLSSPPEPTCPDQFTLHKASRYPNQHQHQFLTVLKHERAFADATIVNRERSLRRRDLCGVRLDHALKDQSITADQRHIIVE